MSKDIPSTLARVRDSASTLNRLCDRAAESVKSLEEFLARECNVGVNAHVRVWTEEDEHHAESLSLCYGRWGSHFRVYLEWYDTSMPPEYSVTKAWAECTREDKLLTLPLLADLITAIDDELNQRIKKAESAITQIGQFCVPPVTKKGGDKNAIK